MGRALWRSLEISATNKHNDLLRRMASMGTAVSGAVAATMLMAQNFPRWSMSDRGWGLIS